ncbi:MAG: hypothetical protein FWC42_01895 [Proteobacteria bacterium]|nr:hypothetical protein [Pseudomonadota bacterium]
MFSRAFSKIGLLLAIFVAALMTACGGGSGSPQQPIKLYLSESKISYGPITLEIYGGRPPFQIRTNSSAVEFPTESDSRTVHGFVYPTSDDGTGVVSVWDVLQGPTSPTVITFEAPGAKFDPSVLTVTATNNTGCTTGQGGNYTQICAGSPGIAELQLNGMGGAVNGAAVQFNVLLGDYQIRADSNSAWGTSVVTMTDSAGKAQVAIQTRTGASTQMAVIGVKTSGIVLNATFVIVGSNFMILPGSVSWQSPTTTCPAKAASFSVFGGTPPYTMLSAIGTPTPSTVAASGGSVVLSVAQCGSGELTARDAVGSTATATIEYAASTSTPTPTPTPVVVTPIGGTTAWGSSTARVSCAAGATFTFTVTGGKSPYNAFAVPAGANPTVTASGAVGQVTFAAPPAANSNFAIYVVDSDGSMSTTTPIIYCQ